MKRGDFLAVFVSYAVHETADRMAQCERPDADTVVVELGRRDNTGEIADLGWFDIRDEKEALEVATKAQETFECGLIVTETP